MPTSLHVTPRGDLVGHDTATDDADCVCGPVVHLVEQKHGGTGWLIVHNSLDGREWQEVDDV